MQQSKDCWGADSKEFKPERWLPDGINTMYNYWLLVCLLCIKLNWPVFANCAQFGLGYNRCPGEHLAEIQIFKIAATIVRDYKISQVDPDKEWEWKAYFTVVPHSWPVYVKRG